MPNFALTFAVPMDYKLAQLPGTPSTTPQETVPSGGDYFTSKVISSARPSSDYQEGAVSPMAPPHSLHLTVVERLIPPHSVSEVRNMLSSKPKYYLAQRLEELTPKNGTLVFIHPTRAGAQTFAREYLTRLLDPVLRSMTIRYDLTMRFSEAIGTLESLNAIPGFEQMREVLHQLCRNVSKPSDEQESKSGSQYNITYAKTIQEEFSPHVCASWWAEQEKHRLEQIVLNYFRTSNRTPKSENGAEVPRNTLVNEVLQGVVNNAKILKIKPAIELGVFVIKKSQS